MVQKKIILIAFLVLFLAFVSANSLEQVKIKSNVPLNENLTVSGYYSADSNSGVLCSFKIYDVQTADKYLIKRLSDEYTFSNGSFSTEFKITEPLFQRGFDYNLTVCCNTACYDKNFYVAQKEDIFLGYSTQSLFLDVLFFRSNETLIYLIFFIIFVLFILWVWSFRRR